jgi:hypothetical protein
MASKSASDLIAVLPVEALSATVVIVGLGYGYRWLFKEYQEWVRNH